MNKKILRFFGNEDLHRIMILIFAVAVTFAVAVSIYPKSRYALNVYDISPVDIKAPADIENNLATLRSAGEARNAVSPVIIDTKDGITSGFETINTYTTFLYDLRRFYSIDDINGGVTYTRTLEEFRTWLEEKNIQVTEAQVNYFINGAEEGEFFRFINVTFDIFAGVSANDILASDVSDNIVFAQNAFRQKGLSEELISAGQSLLSSIITSNRVIDEILTNQIKDRAYYIVLQTEKEFIEKGDIIVRKNTVITPEVYDIMKQAGLLRDKGITGYLDFLMILLYILSLYLFFLIYMKYFYKKAYRGRKEELLILLLIVIVLALSRGAVEINPLLIPLYMAPIMIAVLLELRLAIIFNIMLTFVVAIFTQSYELLFTLFLGGTFAAMFVQNKKQRSKLSLAGIFSAFVSAIIYIIASVVFGNDIIRAVNESLYILTSGVFSILLIVGLLPLFEIIFNIITSSKLLELSNPNQPLLKKLLMEAPGTYHHSLMVGNLAEEATDKIGGNSLLARVGAYYHDIGKSQRPQYFTENQKGENPHDEMNPKLSSYVLISHVNDGVKLAREHKLPPLIIDFIKTHHGDTLTTYFYHKAKGNEKNKEVAEKDYRYGGPKPYSKEGAVVMLADSVEAAVKSLEEKTPENIEAFIKKIIKNKLDEGQLDNCDLTLLDLSRIAGSFAHVLSGYYHTRIAYPEMPEKEDK